MLSWLSDGNSQHPGVYRFLPAAGRAEAFLLGVGGAADHFAHQLGDGIAVNPEDSEKLLGLTAAGHLRNRQAVDVVVLHCDDASSGGPRIVDNGLGVKRFDVQRQPKPHEG
ncbi:unnamed protein product [Menidia menidia]|uniref:(Atlantic silverside) hypothetical protein n=1 Tax=Menidia menidia TaxID=238744 RepID=A0A8S4BPZ7_9TELE|nr:unnamed protein product [Menidia menidia]